MTAPPIEDRFRVLEATAYRHGEHLSELNSVAQQIGGKLDDLSGQVRVVRLDVRELGDRVTALEAAVTGLRTEVTGLRTEVTGLRTEVTGQGQLLRAIAAHLGVGDGPTPG